jgi:glutamate-1-semialdehyde aminotransferase
MAPSGFEVGFLSLAHTEDICRTALKLFEQALKEVYEN